MEQTKINVGYVAHLARLSLAPEEEARLGEELRQVVAYFEKLQEVDVAGIEPTIHGQNVHNVFRQDVRRPSLDREQVLELAPERLGDEFRMPRVVE